MNLLGSFRLITSAKSAIVGTLLTVTPLLLLSIEPLLCLYTVMIVFFLMPAALCTVTAVCGLLPAFFGLCAGIFAMRSGLGSDGILYALIYLVPVFAGFLYLYPRKMPFFKLCGCLIGIHVAAIAVCVLLLQSRSGSAGIYTGAADAAVEWVKNSGFTDGLLVQLYSAGVVGIPEELKEGMIQRTINGNQLSQAVRADMFLSLHAAVEGGLQALLPVLLAQQSIYGGVLCLLLPVHYGRIAAEKRAVRYPESENGEFVSPDMPPFSLWHIPRGIGWKVGVALMAGYVLQLFGQTGPVWLAGILLYVAAGCVFSVQGAAALNFRQKSRGTKKVWRYLVPILLEIFSILPYFGIFDQLTDARRLRTNKNKEDHQL